MVLNIIQAPGYFRLGIRIFALISLQWPFWEMCRWVGLRSEVKDVEMFLFCIILIRVFMFYLEMLNRIFVVNYIN